MLRGEDFFKPLVTSSIRLRVLPLREQKYRPGDTKCPASAEHVDIHPKPIKRSRTEGMMTSLTFPSSSLASASSPDDEATPPEPQKPQEPLSPLQPPAGPKSSTAAADRPTFPSDAKLDEPVTRFTPEHEDGQSGSTAASPPPLLSSLHPIEFHEDCTISLPVYSRPTISTLRISSSAAFSFATSFLAEALSSDGTTTASLSTRRRLAVLRLWLRRMRWAIKTVKYVRGARKFLMRK